MMSTRIKQLFGRYDAIYETASLGLAVVCLAAIIYFTIPHVFAHRCDFCPLVLDRLEVSPEVLVLGQPAELRDGLCNKGDVPVFSQITLILEPKLASLTTTSVTLSDTMRSIDPKACPGARVLPVPVVPENIPLGEWRLTARVVGRSKSGQMQLLTKSSNYFLVLPASGVRP